LSGSSHVFGIHAVRSLLQRSPQRLRRLIVDVRRDDPRMRELLQLAQGAGVNGRQSRTR
jgi:23S rRNA (guanosine2251-2'-O)-methyltransferase